MMKRVFKKVKKLFLLHIMRRKYTRKGQCKGCGRCCQEIYVKHAKGVIKDEAEYKKLRKLHPFYTYLKVVDKTEDGLVFACTKLDKTTNKCSIYKKRALLCKLYPQEEIFMMGGVISDDCGYEFVPIQSFEEVLSKVKKK